MAVLTQEQLKAAVELETAKILSIRAKIAPLEAQINKHHAKREKLEQKIRDLHKDDFAYLMFDTNAYKELEKFLPKKNQVMLNGYWPEFKERGFQLWLRREESVNAELIDFVLLWAKHTKKCRMGILRWDCGEDGSWVLEIKDGKWRVFNCRHEKYHVTIEFEGELEQALKFVQKNHGAERDSRDEDEY